MKTLKNFSVYFFIFSIVFGSVFFYLFVFCKTCVLLIELSILLFLIFFVLFCIFREFYLYTTYTEIKKTLEKLKFHVNINKKTVTAINYNKNIKLIFVLGYNIKITAIDMYSCKKTNFFMNIFDSADLFFGLRLCCIYINW